MSNLLRMEAGSQFLEVKMFRGVFLIYRYDSGFMIVLVSPYDSDRMCG